MLCKNFCFLPQLNRSVFNIKWKIINASIQCFNVRFGLFRFENSMFWLFLVSNFSFQIWFHLKWKIHYKESTLTEGRLRKFCYLLADRRRLLIYCIAKNHVMITRSVGIRKLKTHSMNECFYFHVKLYRINDTHLNFGAVDIIIFSFL